MNMILGIFLWILSALNILIFIRVLLGWFYPVGRDPWTKLLVDFTEPILAPIRSVLSRFINLPIDLSPIVAWLLIILLQRLLTSAAL